MIDIQATPAPAFTLAVDNGEFRFTALNDACLRASGIDAEAHVGKTPQEYFPAPLAKTLLGHYRQCATSRLPVSYEIEFILPGGYTCWRTTLVPIVSPETGDVSTILGICIDATADKITELARTAFHENLSAAFGALTGGFWVFEPTTGFFEASRPLTELLAGPGHPLLNQAEYINFIYAEDLTSFPDQTRDSAADFRVMTYDGRTRWMHSKRRVIRDESGAMVRLVALVVDVTDERMRRRKLEDEATTDELTGLKNRRGFERIAVSQMGYGFDATNPFALILIDLDKFKPVNDLFGHKAGDDVLKGVARRISRTVRPKDAVARIGGDEFAILVRSKGLPLVLERLERAFQHPFQYHRTPIFVGASLGATCQEPGDRTLADVMQRADAALYAVKNRRRLLTA